MGVLAGAFIGLITLRLSGIYFGLAMLCYPTATVYLFEYLGLQELTIPMQRENALYFMQFEDQTGYSFVALILLTIGMMISFTIENSRMGLWLRLIRQNEPAAQALGVDCFRWKFLALLISGGLGRCSGSIICTGRANHHTTQRFRYFSFCTSHHPDPIRGYWDILGSCTRGWHSCPIRRAFKVPIGRDSNPELVA